jgi:Ca2+/H+ antiporter, TMEM165/GDT1 family
MRWALGGSFIAVALWMLVPDRADALKGDAGPGRLGVFGVTVIAFFLAEMGDKTQIATVMLAARFDALWVVTAGTTLGMMIANVPAVLLGERAVRVLPVAWVHRIAAAVFAAIGIAVLAGLRL